MLLALGWIGSGEAVLAAVASGMMSPVLRSAADHQIFESEPEVIRTNAFCSLSETEVSQIAFNRRERQRNAILVKRKTL
jgi:hypothetical protein